MIWRPRKKELDTSDLVHYFSGINWNPREDVPYGSLCLPYDTFVKKILSLLEYVNGETTVISTSEFIDGKRKIKPEIFWGDTKTIKTAPRACMFRSNGSYEYVYQKRDSAKYIHEDHSDGERYEIDCTLDSIASKTSITEIGQSYHQEYTLTADFKVRNPSNRN